MSNPDVHWIVVTDENSLPPMSAWFVFPNPQWWSSSSPPYLVGQYFGQTLDEFKEIKRYMLIPDIDHCALCGQICTREEREYDYNIFNFVCNDCNDKRRDEC